ncbi:MAG: PsbP-related protein [Ignavibacteria bacterium]|nr:PsbP-related protein [Ignavibacteria bacterium]
MIHQKLFKWFPVLLLVLFVSCGKKEPQKINFAFQGYENPTLRYHIEYPKGWTLTTDPGKVRLLSSQDAYDKFVDPTSKGSIGALVIISTSKDSLAGDLQKFYEATLAFDKDRESIEKYEEVTDTKVGDKPAKRLYYRLKYDKSTIKKVEKYLVTTDTLDYIIEFISFNEMFESYKPAVEKLVSTFGFPKKLEKGEEDPGNKPSGAFSTYNNPLYSIEYPDNFNIKAAKKGETGSIATFSGYRLDCTFVVDVFPSQSLSVEKVFDQNKVKNTGAGGQKETTINGLKSIYLNYSVASNIGSRAYFVVKGDKVYRLTLNWFRPQEADYLSAFEKMAASLKVK